MKKNPNTPSPFDPEHPQGQPEQSMRKLHPQQPTGPEEGQFQVQRVAPPEPTPTIPSPSLNKTLSTPTQHSSESQAVHPTRIATPGTTDPVAPLSQRQAEPQPRAPQQPVAQPLTASGRAAVAPTTRKQKKRHKFGWLDATLLLLGILLLALGLYFLLRPHFIAKNQKAVSNALFEMVPVDKNFDSNSEDGILVDPEANKVNGEAWEAFSGEGITYDKNQKVLIKPIARLQIDSIDLNLPILDNAGLVDLRYGIGYYRSSAPLFDDTGLSVLFGHHMFERGHYFNRLNEVKTGDTVRVTGNKKVYTYTVDKTILVTAEEMLSLLNQTTSEKYLLMITCESGLNTNDKRILVYARRTQVEDVGSHS